jgi:hypothetical protein
MEKFEIKVPINNPVENDEELVEKETPTVLNVESITVPALKKEFRYSEDICKEAGIGASIYRFAPRHFLKNF